MDDLEAGKKSRASMVSNADSWIVVRGTRIRLRIYAMCLLAVIPVLAVIIMFFGILTIFYNLGWVPAIGAHGKLGGLIPANVRLLGQGINLTLYPDFDLDLTVNFD